jgi:hypothetical protein
MDLSLFCFTSVACTEPEFFFSLVLIFIITSLFEFLFLFSVPFSCPFLQLTGETVGEVKAVADMHQRKAEMAKHSDAFIALPG